VRSLVVRVRSAVRVVRVSVLKTRSSGDPSCAQAKNVEKWVPLFLKLTTWLSPSRWVYDGNVARRLFLLECRIHVIGFTLAVKGSHSVIT
jgi:hypothetical protein